MNKNTLLTKIQDYIDNLDKKIQLQDVPSENIYHEIAKKFTNSNSNINKR